MVINGKYAWALRLASMGFRVFPVAENTKNRPLVDDWPNLATTDPDQIYRWWHEISPGGPIEQFHNIAILTGDDLHVIDIDVKHGKEGFAHFYRLGGDCDTFTVGTPSGGQHCYYLSSANFANSQGDQGGIAPGIDSRGHHGYVMGPGSTVDGKDYVIALDVPRVPLPTAFADLLKMPGIKLREKFTAPLINMDTPYAIQLVTEYFQSRPAVFIGQGLNNAIYQHACAARDLGVNEDTNIALMWEHWIPRCSPVDYDEVAGIVTNAYDYAQNPAGMKHPAVGFQHLQLEPPPTLRIAGSINRRANVRDDKNRDLWARGYYRADCDIGFRRWVAEDFLMHGEITMLYAPGGVGKSLFTLQVAIFLALGWDIWGFKNIYKGTPKLSIIYNAEDDLDEMWRRLHAACRELKVDPLLVKDYIIMVSGKDVGMRAVTIQDRKPMVNHEDIAALRKAACEHEDCVMIGLDPLVKVHSVHENDNVEMTYVMGILSSIAEEADVALLVAHHTAKPPAAASDTYVGNADSGRGASAIANAARVVFTLHPPTNGDKQDLGLTADQERRLIRIDQAKSNYTLTPTGEALFWLERKTVLRFNGEKVGILVATDVQDQRENDRQNIGRILAAELAATSRGSMPYIEAIRVLRRVNPIYEKDKALKERLDQRMVRPVELDDGRVIALTQNNPRLVTLE